MTTRIRSACAAACALATVLVLVASAVSPGPAFAAVSAVYTAATNPTYENPATGAIEDAAGSSNVALAESMVTSIVYENALIERDTDGTLYASLRFKLADQISSIALEVSADGSSYEPVEAAQMQTGTDSATSTATADYRFAIPSETATVRCSMDVIPMGRAVVYFISFGALQEGDADGTFVQTVTPGEGTEDAAPAAASAADADAAEDEPVQDADDLTGTSPNEGVQEFDEEGREVTGGKQAEASLDGGTLALIAGIAAGVIVVAGVAVYAVYLRPKRAKQASAAAAAAAAASAPAGSDRDKASDAGEAFDADERASRA
ncbi:hypothetical protein H8S61_08400 [Eggerthella sp. NSJ-70]|uniref:Cell surface protein Shp haem-binding domain-containing protein n=1 Tax=Eggerthella hominis TaxID=2763043 RepID=A0ABR7BRG5_9ACTN|nr:heme-binding Shp domain-containing protein [Eggerthella hominis]MBC5584214.1 hypothetical protein [Eggerthella hominis]